MFKINSLAFVKTQGFVHKNKTLNLRPKMSYLGVFKLKFEKKKQKKKTVILFESSTLEFVILQKFV